MPDKDGYPTEEELSTIKNWDILKDGFDGLVDFIISIWWMSGWGVKVAKNKLWLHTGGWSGNEDIIATLQETMFWTMAWQKSERGGHYYFEWKPIKKGKI